MSVDNVLNIQTAGIKLLNIRDQILLEKYSKKPNRKSFFKMKINVSFDRKSETEYMVKYRIPCSAVEERIYFIDKFSCFID